MSDDSIDHLDFAFTEPDVVDLTALDDYRLTVLANKTQESLHDRDEMYALPDELTEEGKRLHSVYLACQIERRRRMNLKD